MLRTAQDMGWTTSSLIALSLLPACEAARGETLPQEPLELHSAHPMATSPARERSWPLLQQWVRGASVDREPTRCPPDGEAALASRGKELFGLYCVNCHGPEGRGDGPRSRVFDPPPRDLAKGTFKFRSTASGSPPTAEDLFRTISGGLRGTGMMPFADLPEDDRWALVTYVQSLSPVRSAIGPTVIAVPEAPDDLQSARRIARGRRAYDVLGCASCHGPRGRGDGPAAPTLQDDEGRPVRALDFATRPPKRGETAADLLSTLVTGLDGTPMPSYAGTAPPRDLQDVAAFVSSIRTSEAGAVDPLDRGEATRLVQGQYAQAVHTVVGGCGCNHQ